MTGCSVDYSAVNNKWQGRDGLLHLFTDKNKIVVKNKDMFNTTLYSVSFFWLYLYCQPNYILVGSKFLN